MPGRGIVIASWVGNSLFVATAIPVAVGFDALDDVAVGVSLALFGVSLLIWTWAFGVAVVRSTRGDDVVVGSMFVTVGDAPARVRWHLFGALGASVAVAAGTAAAEPFGVLVPMLPLGLIGLWAAWYGTFPARREPAGR
jgi:hypothetical protein